MPNRQTSTASFLRSLLEQCIGTVMIEAEQWDFSSPTFDRGYFNRRLKHKDAINRLAHERLNFVFAHLFNPQNPNSRFQEPQAVEAANHLLALWQELFQADCTMWTNHYTEDNHAARTHLLTCLDYILSLCEGESILPVDAIRSKLQQYLREVQAAAQMPANEYPSFLAAAPGAQTEYFIGRTTLVTTVTNALIAGDSLVLCGIGGIGKTETAKAATRQLYQTPTAATGIRYILWVNDSKENFARSLLQTLQISTGTTQLATAFQTAVQMLNQYRNQLLLVIDNVESDTDPYLLQVTEYLACRILITSRIDGFPRLARFFVPPLSAEACQQLFYFYYHGQHDDTSLQHIIELADGNTLAVELLAKIADTEEVFLSEFLENLIRCGFHISEESVRRRPAPPMRSFVPREES